MKFRKNIRLFACVLLGFFYLLGCGKDVPDENSKNVGKDNENMFYEEHSALLDVEAGKYYYYDRLQGTDKELYCILYNCITEGVGEITLPEYINYDIVYRVFRYVSFDHPELYWISGYEITEKRDIMTLRPTVDFDKEQRQFYDQKCDMAVRDILARIGPVKDEYDACEKAYNYLIENTQYAEGYNSQNMLSALLDHKAVCAGLTKAYQYLLQAYNIQSVPVTGYMEDGTPHMWNLVRIDGKYYYTDLTYGNTHSKDGFINYDLFNATTEQVEKFYEFEAGQILQACSSKEASYYNKNKNLYDTVNKEALAVQFKKGLPTIIKCSNKECFRKMKQYLLVNKGIYDYIAEVNIAYKVYEDTYIIYLYIEENI